MKVRIDSGGRAGETVEIDDGMIAGRSADVAIALPDKKASRQHARFLVRNGSLLVEDLGAANRTKINGRPILSATALKPGDVVLVGETTMTVITESEPTPAPTGADSIGGSAIDHGMADGLDDDEIDVEPGDAATAAKPRAAGVPAAEMARRAKEQAEQRKADQATAAAKEQDEAGRRVKAFDLGDDDVQMRQDPGVLLSSRPKSQGLLRRLLPQSGILGDEFGGRPLWQQALMALALVAILGGMFALGLALTGGCDGAPTSRMS